MSDKTQKIVDSIKAVLRNKPSSISEITRESKINWRTAENYLEMLKNLEVVEEKIIKNTRTFFYKHNQNNYFDLPIKPKEAKLISSIYSKIKETCLNLYNKEPTKTQAYKIIWSLNKKLELNLPVGWYRYGPCCVQVYQGDEKEETKLSNNIIKEIKETTKEYCIMDNISLQRMIYTKEEKNLYLTKEKLLDFDSEDKNELNNILMDLIKYTPKDTIGITTDFARATLFLGWNKTRTIFDIFWKYITMVIFKESLEGCYSFDLDPYFDDKIEDAKKEAQLEITNLVRTHLKSK